MSNESIGYWDNSDTNNGMTVFASHHWGPAMPVDPTPVQSQLTSLSLDAIRLIVREELQAHAHQIALDVAEELTRALRLERNIRAEKEKTEKAGRKP